MQDLHDHILSLEILLVQPEVRASKEELNRLLADDFIEFGTSGKKHDKEHTVNQLPKTASQYGGKHEISDFEINVLAPDYVHTTYRSDTTYTDGEQKHAYRSSIWRKEGERWRMVFHQGTRITE